MSAPPREGSRIGRENRLNGASKITLTYVTPPAYFAFLEP